MALDLIRARGAPLEGAMEEDDGEVELTLGLSVGGTPRKAPMADAAAQGRAAEAKSGEAELDLSGHVSSPPSSPRPLPPFFHVDGDGGAALDQARRREIHAFRRREARRKREEKKQQQRRGICRATSGAAPAAKATGSCGIVAPLETACSPEDRLAMEAQEQQVRAKDREARVEALDSVPNHKLSANPSPIPIPIPIPKADANPDPILNPNLVPFTAQSFPVVAMPYSYPHLQYFPTTNGFGIPCMMPCWAPAVSPGAEGPRAESNVFHPVACRAFQPYPRPPDEATNRGSPVSSNAAESNAGKHAGVDAVERAPSWTASQGSSSSPAASGHHSGSPRGSGSSSSSSEERSHSRQSPGKHLQRRPLPQLISLPQGHSDSSISSRPAESDPPQELCQTPCPNGDPSPARPVVSAGAGESGPPPPQVGPGPQLPRMPCVSATGNGPNGRTITGVLYRYTNTEVSIVCACHGSSFSPAEFVQHAGGTDVTHPLRQITVVSS